MNAAMLARFRGAIVVATVVGLTLTPYQAYAALSTAQRNVLTRYVDALQHERYDLAFALLARAERKYFGSARNLASAYGADRLHIDSYKIIGSTAVPSLGTLAIVLERVRFFDHAHQVRGRIAANVRYGIVPAGTGLAIKDPYHPWHAFVPANATIEKNGIHATIRKVSFFTGRIEVVVTFANTGTETATLLAYGRTVVRDDAGKAHVPLATKIAALTDKTLFEGLRLAPSAQYTGALTFTTTGRYTPRSLALTVAPVVADGGDAPFELVLPVIDVPSAQ